jgi:hypothetical protein
MSMDSHITLLLYEAELKKYRGLPIRMPTTREELSQLHTRLSLAYAAVALRCAGPDEQRLMAWYDVHRTEVEQLGDWFLCEDKPAQ